MIIMWIKESNDILTKSNYIIKHIEIQQIST